MEEMKALLLALFDDRHRYGYEFIRMIKSKSRGAYAPSSGMIYPALADLADAGLIEQVGEDQGRKAYALLDKGRTERSQHVQLVTELEARLADAGKRTSSRTPSIERALVNLQMAVDHAVQVADTEAVDRIVDLIDRAAREIERTASGANG